VDVPLWVKQLAAVCWDRAGPPGPFPRSLRITARALRLSVVELPRLRLSSVKTWLDRQDITCCLDAADRSLRACLVARQGRGFLFLDPLDDVNEQRFSLAHEIAHFLRDYWQPRQQAIERLGPAIVEVLDGLRAPRPEERLRGVLAAVPIGFHTHLLSRESGRLSPALAKVEEDADRLAFELLAPTEAIWERKLTDEPGLADRLVAEFGLPATMAARYAELLRPAAAEVDPLLLRWKIGRKLSNSGRGLGSSGRGSKEDG